MNAVLSFSLFFRSIPCSFAFRYLLKKGSNPSYYPKKAKCIFLFHAFFDFQNSEKNGEKKRKPAKFAGFPPQIY